MGGYQPKKGITVMIIIIAIIVAAVLVGAAAAGWASYDKRRLRASFGPEYETVAQDLDTPREVDRELRRRKNAHDGLNLQTVSAQDRESYAESWAHLQAEFLDDPALSLNNAEHLVATLLKTTGYPGGDPDEQLALLSVEHANSLADYRAAQQISRHAKADPASTPTEEMRQALLSYHVLFTELLTDPAAATSTTAGSTDHTSTPREIHDLEATT
jgi:hypothetical protein